MKSKQTPQFVPWLLLAWLSVAPNAFAFYNPTAGRWLNRDPLEETAGQNVYHFSRNEPVGSIDVLGLWHTSGHHQIIEAWLDSSYHQKKVCCCDLDVIALLESASDVLDEQTGTSSRLAFKHAMRSPYESVSQAQRAYESFVGESVRFARQCADEAKTEGKTPCAQIELALSELGEAIHAYTDSFSPAHSGFQVWYGNEWQVFTVGLITTIWAEHAALEPNSKIPSSGVVFAVGQKFGADLDYVLGPCQSK